MSTRQRLEQFRDDNPDLASFVQLALDAGEDDQQLWEHVVKLVSMYERPEMTERELTLRMERWDKDTALDDKHLYHKLMAERLKGQLQAYEMCLYRMSAFSLRRAIEITRGELRSLEGLIEYSEGKTENDMA